MSMNDAKQAAREWLTTIRKDGPRLNWFANEREVYNAVSLLVPSLASLLESREAELIERIDALEDAVRENLPEVTADADGNLEANEVCRIETVGLLYREMEKREAELRAERDEARKAIAWANNSLFGSHGFFLSLSGDAPNDEHHLDRAIEDLKAAARERDAALSQVAALRDGIKRFIDAAHSYEVVTQTRAAFENADSVYNDTAAAARAFVERIRREAFAEGQAERVASIMHNPDIDGNSLAAMLRREGYERGAREQLEVSQQYVEQVRREERERCAKVVEAHYPPVENMQQSLAAAIRARGVGDGL